MRQNKYKLLVVAHGRPGFYGADTLFGVLWGVIFHRTMHLIRHGRWRDS